MNQESLFIHFFRPQSFNVYLFKNFLRLVPRSSQGFASNPWMINLRAMIEIFNFSRMMVWFGLKTYLLKDLRYCRLEKVVVILNSVPIEMQMLVNKIEIYFLLGPRFKPLKQLFICLAFRILAQEWEKINFIANFRFQTSSCPCLSLSRCSNYHN